MRRWNLLPIVLLGATACGGDEPAADDQVPVEQTSPTAVASDSGAAMDTTTMPQAPAQPRAQTTPAPPQTPTRLAPVRRPETSRLAAADEPWTPTHTGTVSPGMTRDDVIAQWGPPVAERASGDWTYLYFRNGCEATCGTFDVVFLQGGAVVDAIVRGPGHTYGGTSSSPPGQEARATPPSGTEA